MVREQVEANGIFLGWKVVATAFVVALFSWGFAFYGSGVFLHALHQDRGWPISVISSAITTQYVLSAGVVAYLSDIHQRLGIARTTRIGMVLLALGTLGWALAPEPWQLFPLSLVTGAGWAVTSGAAINAMVSPWFDRRRASALSHALNGASVGGVIMTPLWTASIGALGFPAAAALLGAVMLAMIWPLAGAYLQCAPHELGLLPDGAAAGTVPATTEPAQPPLSRAALFRTPRFLTLSMAFALALFAQVGLLAHLVSMMAPRLGDPGAAVAVSVTTVAAITGRLLMAAVPPEFDRRIASALNLLLQVAGSALLTLGTPIPSFVGCALFGLGVGNVVSLPPLIAQAEFSSADVLRVVALVTAVNQVFFAFAPALFGTLRDLTGSYALPIALAAALQIAATIVILLGRSAGARSDQAPGAVPSNASRNRFLM
jgi:cyanate permease